MTERKTSTVLVGVGSVAFAEYDGIHYYSRDLYAHIGEDVAVEPTDRKGKGLTPPEVKVFLNDSFLCYALEHDTFKADERKTKKQNGKSGKRGKGNGRTIRGYNYG